MAADLTLLTDLMTDQLKQRPHDPDLHHRIGVLYLQNGLEQQGLSWLRRTLALDPMHRPAHQAFIDYYEKLGQPENALAHRRKLQ